MNGIPSWCLCALVASALASSSIGQRGPSQEPRPPASDLDPAELALEELRGLLALAQAAFETGDVHEARALVNAAIERGLEELDGHAGAADLLVALASGARRFGDLTATERARRAVVELRARTLPEGDPDLVRARLSLALSLVDLGDLPGARALQESVLEVLERQSPPDATAVLRARQHLAVTLDAIGDFEGARSLEEAIVEQLERTLPADHADLQRARRNLAVTLRQLRDLEGARALEELVLEVFERTLPPEHEELLITRQNLALTMHAIGDFRGACALQESVLEVRERASGPDHADTQHSRQNLAFILGALGELELVRELEETVLESYERTLPAEHPEILWARGNLALTIKALGDLEGAHALEESVLAAFERSMSPEHPDLQVARGNLALTLNALGDLEGARALEEAVLRARERSLPPTHPHLQVARKNLAVTLKELGELDRARALEETVLAVCERTWAPEHPDVQHARQNLAVTLRLLGDLQGARALEESLLGLRERTLPADHPEIQRARQNLAATLRARGDLEGARALEELVLEVRERTLPPRHPELQAARVNLAATMYALGDHEGARAHFEAVIGVFEETLPPAHPDRLTTQGNLALTLRELGDLQGARAILESVLTVRELVLPAEHPSLQGTRESLAVTIARQAARGPEELGGQEPLETARARCVELLLSICDAQVRAARAALLASSVREAEERCARLAAALDAGLSFAHGYGVFEAAPALAEACFVLSERTRAAGLAVADLLRVAASSPECAGARDRLRRASLALARLAQEETASAEFHSARMEREEAERELLTLGRELPGRHSLQADFDVDAIAGRLGERDAAVAFRRYSRSELERASEHGGDGRALERSVESLCAFVLRGAGGSAEPRFALVELGPVEAIDAAVRDWRNSLGAARGRGVGVNGAAGGDEQAQGRRLRRIAWDPLLEALGDAERVILALDDVLHLVAFDALPLDDGGELVGDRWRIETRVALWELLEPRPVMPGGGLLAALGGATFDAPPAAPGDEEVEVVPTASGAPVVASLLRGGAWERGFAPLEATAPEARGIAALHGATFAGEAESLVLEHRRASRAALEATAPRARFLHVATHGWFAPEAIGSWDDLDAQGTARELGLLSSRAEVVRGMSPMLLCGLAFAGANLPEGALGRAPGLMTAEELSTLDLGRCELAVLSACDTNVGERRAGQGVASLQKALHMAGARSVITSLWKVPDDATRELMLDFYRRLWVDRVPKAQALWEAKRELRDARDERGNPRFTTRDWAAWILTGEPD